MSSRFFASIAIVLAAAIFGHGSLAGEGEPGADESKFGIAVPRLVPPFPDVFTEAGEGIRFASCYVLDPDMKGPVEGHLMFLPHEASEYPYFDAVFFWIASDEKGRFLGNYGWVRLEDDDITVQAANGGDWIDEHMERAIIPLLNSHPRLTHSPAQIFDRPHRRCRLSAAWDYHNPKPRHRPKIKPEWFSAK